MFDKEMFFKFWLPMGLTGGFFIYALISVTAPLNCEPTKFNKISKLAAYLVPFLFLYLYALKAGLIAAALQAKSPAAARLLTSWLIGLFVLLVIVFAYFYKASGILSTDAGAIPLTTDYLYFSVVTFTTLGYGDFRPCPNIRLVAAAQALIGFLYYPFVIVVILHRLGFSKAGK